MSNTPRTDAYIEERVGLGEESLLDARNLADFARQIERDLALLIEAIRAECSIPEGIRQALLKVTNKEST